MSLTSHYLQNAIWFYVELTLNQDLNPSEPLEDGMKAAIQNFLVSKELDTTIWIIPQKDELDPEDLKFTKSFFAISVLRWLLTNEAQIGEHLKKLFPDQENIKEFLITLLESEIKNLSENYLSSYFLIHEFLLTNFKELDSKLNLKLSDYTNTVIYKLLDGNNDIHSNEEKLKRLKLFETYIVTLLNNSAENHDKLRNTISKYFEIISSLLNVQDILVCRQWLASCFNMLKLLQAKKILDISNETAELLKNHHDFSLKFLPFALYQSKQFFFENTRILLPAILIVGAMVVTIMLLIPILYFLENSIFHLPRQLYFPDQDNNIYFDFADLSWRHNPDRLNVLLEEEQIPLFLNGPFINLEASEKQILSMGRYVYSVASQKLRFAILFCLAMEVICCLISPIIIGGASLLHLWDENNLYLSNKFPDELKKKLTPLHLSVNGTNKYRLFSENRRFNITEIINAANDKNQDEKNDTRVQLQLTLSHACL